MPTSQNPWPFAVPDRGASGGGIVCLGHALVDRLVEADAGAVQAAGLEPGAMTLVEASTARRIGAALTGWRHVAGGSAANTAAGVAAFGERATLVATVGADDDGRGYLEKIESIGVHCVAHEATTGQPTGVCHVLVTADGDRTMATHLGAAPGLSRAAVDASGIESAACVYVEGYLLDAAAAEALARAAEIAKASGTPFALSLSDPFVVDRHHDTILRLIDDGTVDLLFGNEDEAKALLGLSGSPADDPSALIRRPGYAFVMTRGAQGSLVVSEEGVVEAPAHAVERVVDTTGAGDLFAAGVLVGLARRADLLECLNLGSLAAAEIISHLGAQPEIDLASLAPA